MNAVGTLINLSSGLVGGLFGVGLGLAGLPGANGSILQGAHGLFR